MHYIWYYIYRPVGAEPGRDQILEPAQVRDLRQFLVDIRGRADAMIVDAYWDHDGNPVCAAASGLGCHIGPGGWVEPCPPVQFSDRCLVGEGVNVRDCLSSSEFWEAFRRDISKKTGGCVLMDCPDELASLVAEHGATDTSGRGTGVEELRASCVCASHDMGEGRIPEKQWVYRMAKKLSFFGLGAYG